MWPDYIRAELRNNVHGCSRHGLGHGQARRNGQKELHLFQKRLLCWEYNRSCSYLVAVGGVCALFPQLTACLFTPAPKTNKESGHYFSFAKFRSRRLAKCLSASGTVNRGLTIRT